MATATGGGDVRPQTHLSHGECVECCLLVGYRPGDLCSLEGKTSGIRHVVENHSGMLMAHH